MDATTAEGAELNETNREPAETERRVAVVATPHISRRYRLGLPSSRILLLGEALTAIGSPIPLDALHRLNQDADRNWRPTVTDDDKHRLAAAEAKRARKAARLMGQLR
ncbi:hypothetical protein [Burkholderia sp. Ac-20349]|uniref:hypothetical protein n=1 Tax=Burkholderia sp. Ac-20349 TaxID=2703893 RepID=UPI00197C319A|nr:hypothetical protein [Burkholderia sp. Ac-20349]MBN3839302.1 hypothetical protein [Burkholderia sp. Ac-20349]